MEAFKRDVERADPKRPTGWRAEALDKQCTMTPDASERHTKEMM
jgi:hypothetical protein